MKKYIASLLVGLGTAGIAQNISIEANLSTIYPTQEFKENTGDVFLGYGTTVKYHSMLAPFINYTASYNQYEIGSESFNSAIFVGDQSQEAELHLKSRISNVAIGLEIAAPRMNITPIIGANVGANFYNTKRFHTAEIGIPQANGKTSYSEQRIGETSSVVGANWNATWYGGVKWNITRLVNLSATFGKSHTTQANYHIIENPTYSKDGNASLIQKNSATDYFQGNLRIGVTF
jgi:hypothetical protein